MPKLKTRKSLAKRVRMTASGKIKHLSAYGRHMLSKKSARRKRRLGQAVYISGADLGTIKKLLPYGRP
ncbi:MAG: 50S ribosomal protein L35 [Candidatus Omnitrophota bacterium]